MSGLYLTAMIIHGLSASSNILLYKSNVVFYESPTSPRFSHAFTQYIASAGSVVFLIRATIFSSSTLEACLAVFSGDAVDGWSQTRELRRYSTCVSWEQVFSEIGGCV